MHTVCRLKSSEGQGYQNFLYKISEQRDCQKYNGRNTVDI